MGPDVLDMTRLPDEFDDIDEFPVPPTVFSTRSGADVSADAIAHSATDSEG